ncbi:hypothetical protein CEE36_06800 [candidate division TA06 bacterium B3_TA06]|uniref:Secretion system C-terminal sorting domain-containing protein n=1 Tax=candidate division TA06 bacterium B3_TA06 TaxID=2012487 RepID=A0A532V6G1_UNCT6|nr:MAG: hypothetical protein CEE36_06800 [candidate division TA06 bacterium B3_TA06]
MTKKVIGIAAALVLFAALVLPLNAQLSSVLHEEFEGTFPPTDWTTTNDGGTNQWFTNGYWGSPNYAGGSGMCADNDDDAAGWGAPWCQNNALVTPSMDLSTATEVWLAYTISYNLLSSTNEHARIEVYDGSSWQNIVTYTSDQDAYGPGQRDSFDISSYAAGEADVQVRFVYNEINYAGWYWWLEIDNVDVWADVGGGSVIDTVVNEGFEGPWPPSGWTTTIGSGNDQWRDLNGLGGFWANYAASGGGNCAENDDYWATNFLGWPQCVENALVTPAFTLGGNIWLEFDRGTYMAPTSEMRVEVWDGSTWQLITSYTLSQLWMHDVWSLSAFGVDGVTDAQVRFVYNETSPSSSLFYQIDNVLIYGETSGTEELDPQMAQIIRPRNEEEGGVSFTPACRVLNNLDTATAKVGCRFKDLETMETVYEDVLNSVPLEQGYTVVDGFRDFTPEANKEYTALFWVEHPDDIDQTNNAKDKHWTTFAGMDVTPTVMLSPAPQQDNEFDPEATFEEHAGAELTVATLHCKIEDGEYHAVVYEDSVIGEPFAVEESKNIKFPTVEGLENGTYTITFWATEERGGNISNPPLVETFEYSGIAEEPVAERFSLDVAGSRISFTLPTATNVNLRVYDVAGNVVATLVDDSRGPGYYTINWNTDAVASGVYFVRMLTPEFNATRKVLILH